MPQAADRGAEEGGTDLTDLFSGEPGEASPHKVSTSAKPVRTTSKSVTTPPPQAVATSTKGDEAWRGITMRGQGKWRAQMWYKCKCVVAGSAHPTAAEAAKAYNVMARLIHGDQHKVGPTSATSHP